MIADISWTKRTPLRLRFSSSLMPSFIATTKAVSFGKEWTAIKLGEDTGKEESENPSLPRRKPGLRLELDSTQPSPAKTVNEDHSLLLI
jgi:hypothetical protein